MSERMYRSFVRSFVEMNRNQYWNHDMEAMALYLPSLQKPSVVAGFLNFVTALSTSGRVDGTPLAPKSRVYVHVPW